MKEGEALQTVTTILNESAKGLAAVGVLSKMICSKDSIQLFEHRPFERLDRLVINRLTLPETGELGLEGGTAKRLLELRPAVKFSNRLHIQIERMMKEPAGG